MIHDCTKIVWVKLLVNNLKSLSAGFIAEYLPKQDLSFTLALTIEPDRLPRCIPIFYQQIFDYWYNAQRDPTNIKTSEVNAYGIINSSK